VLGIFLASKVSKYKTFWDKLTFSLKKVKLQAKFPYDRFDFVITMEAYNPTETSVSLNGATGTISMQGKTIANINGGFVNIKQGRNFFDINTTLSIEQINNIIGAKYNTTSFSAFASAISREPFVTDITYNTSLGNIKSVDTWRLSDFA
jgi:LEA14-like dessication related protein